jgi:hypothetical protein
MGTSVEGRSATTAAFFDLDKTIISRSSALAFASPFYRHGLITRIQVLRGACTIAHSPDRRWSLQDRAGMRAGQRGAGYRQCRLYGCGPAKADHVRELAAQGGHRRSDGYACNDLGTDLCCWRCRTSASGKPRSRAAHSRQAALLALPSGRRVRRGAGWLHVSCVIDSDNESITLGPFQSRRWPVERNYGRTRSPYTAAGYPRATSRGRRAVAGELGNNLVRLPRQ